MIKRLIWSKSLRVKMVLTFFATLILTVLLGSGADLLTQDLRKQSYTSFEKSKNAVKEKLKLLEQKLPELGSPGDVNPLLIRESDNNRLQIYISDLQGNVVYHSEAVPKTRIDLYEIIYEQKETLNNPASGKEYTEALPILYQGQKLFLIVTGKLRAEQEFSYYDVPVYDLILFLSLFWVLFYLLTYKKMKQFQEISAGVERIAQGNLSIRLPVRSKDELGTLTNSINEMAGQLEEQIAKERLAEKTKSELITNISHDLRTPLTSIIGYLSVLAEHRDTSGSLQPYVQSALNKSNQLKKLIDDLFEYTRLASNQVALDKSLIDMGGLLNQIVMEFIPLAEQHDVGVQSNVPCQKVEVAIDAGQVVRAIDNLLTNALKFSDKPGTIDISLHADADWVILSVANTGPEITKEQELQLFDRFYKAEESRHDHRMPHGSGLGLSIAQSIVQLHGGDIWLQRKERHYEFFIRIPRTRK